MPTTMPTPQEIDTLIQYFPKLYAEGFKPVNAWPTAFMASPSYQDAVDAFIEEASRECWQDYDYQPNEAAKVIHDASFIGRATLSEIRTLLTYCIRGERLCSGHVAGMIEDQTVRHILERLKSIRQEKTNPQLTPEQREQLFEPLFEKTKNELTRCAKGDERLLWALRRKLAKELVYLERGKPTDRAKLKTLMWKKQEGICALCNKPMEKKGSELDRFNAFDGYTESNVRLVHHECHVADQTKKGFA